MLRRGRHRKSSGWCRLALNDELDGKDDQRQNEKQQADAVDAVHILHPLGARPGRVRLTEVEIFCYLLKNAHKKTAS